MPTGTVKFFNDEKGYGFISRSDGEPDIFVHFSNIEGTGRRTLVAGQEVEFELGQGRKGTEANNVRAIWAPRLTRSSFASLVRCECFVSIVR